MASSRNSLASMLREVAERLEHSQTRNSSSSSASPSTSNNAVLTPRHQVDTEVARLFGPYSSGGSGSTRRWFSPLPGISSYTRSFCCLEDKNAQIVPNRSAKERLAAAGLGEKHLTYRGSQTNPNQFRDFILEAYPKLRQGGGFELLRISGATKTRQLTLIPRPNEGYNVKHLKDPQMLLGHTTIFIRPLQRNLNIDTASQPESSELAGPPQKCMTCGAEFPFLSTKANSDDCPRSLQGGSEVRSEVAVSANLMARDSIDLDSTEEGAWQIDPNPTEAVKKFKEDVLRRHATGKPLRLTMDLGDSTEERERAILSFYKMANVEWACPLRCTIKGDPAVGSGVTRHFFATIMSKLQYGFDINLVPGGTLLFEGEKDHLIPSTSYLLLESDLFLVAGRMIGHSFLHGGPCLAGLSPAILHMLFGGSPEEATIEIADCSDLDIRQTVNLLDGTAELSAEDKRAVNELALAWDLPVCTSENRNWLLDKLLLHAVVFRTSKQVKQLRRGLKETLIWPLLTERRDTIPLLFPRTSSTLCTPQLVLERIKWPTDDEDSDVSLEDACRITGFLRVFIENASQNLLGKLLEFWEGWSLLPRYLKVEVVKSNFPESSTCFHLLKLPAHYMEYSAFERDILAAIWSTDTGFGLV